jgi:hypothetical protein
VFTMPPFSFFHSYPMGAILKPSLPDAPLEIRPLTDNSHTCVSMNAGIHPDAVERVTYTTVQEFLDALTALRARFPGCQIFLAKEDVTKAYRNLHVRPSDLWLCVRTWDGKFIVDLRVAFGGAFAPAAYTEVTRALQFVWDSTAAVTPALDVTIAELPPGTTDADVLELLTATEEELAALTSPVARLFVEERARARAHAAINHQRGVATLMLSEVTCRSSVLDDHFAGAVGILNSIMCSRIIIGTMRAWRLPLHKKKLRKEGCPRTSYPILGVGVDLEHWRVFVTADRVALCVSQLRRLLEGDRAKYADLQSVAMRLLFCCVGVVRGRFHLNGAFQALRGKSHGDVIVFTTPLIRNLRWWLAFFADDHYGPWDGASFLPAVTLTAGDASSDASDYGFGLYFRGYYCFGPWLPDERALHVSVREAIALFILAELFHEPMRAMTVPIDVRDVEMPLDQDNSGVYWAYTAQRMGSGPVAAQLSEMLTLVDVGAARHSIRIKMRLVPSAKNTLSDLPSRNRIEEFLAHQRSVHPHFTPQQVPFPDDLRTLWRSRLGLC